MVGYKQKDALDVLKNRIRSCDLNNKLLFLYDMYPPHQRGLDTVDLQCLRFLVGCGWRIYNGVPFEFPVKKTYYDWLEEYVAEKKRRDAILSLSECFAGMEKSFVNSVRNVKELGYK